MRVLIFGSRGFFGQEFLKLYPDAVASSADIADAAAVAKALADIRPDVVINAAGKTGRPNIDWCEEHKLETLRANVTGPLVLVEECAKRGIYWVHLGSGCIYEGDNGGKGFSEQDPPNFFGSFYSRTKAWSEQILKDLADPKEGRGGILILRLRMPFDGSLNDRNLIMKVRKYGRVLDTENSLTFVPDFLKVAHALIGQRATGPFNIVNAGVISPYRIMELYREIVDPAHRFERLTLAELPEVARAGRSNCMLSTKKIEAMGFRLRSVEEAVKQALEEIRKKL